METRLCIASCSELIAAGEQLTTETYGISGCDENELYAALNARGVQYDLRAWDGTTVSWASYSTVIVRTTWDYSKSEQVASRFTDWLSSLRIAGVAVYNDSAILAWNIHKGYLQELAGEGVRVIPTDLISYCPWKGYITFLKHILLRSDQMIANLAIK